MKSLVFCKMSTIISLNWDVEKLIWIVLYVPVPRVRLITWPRKLPSSRYVSLSNIMTRPNQQLIYQAIHTKLIFTAILQEWDHISNHTDLKQRGSCDIYV